MDIVHDRAVGMDISKRDAKVCVRVPGNRPGQFTSTVTTWGATTNQILELREFLEHEQVTTVVMEATSDYWKPFFYLLEESLPVMLVNAKSARNIPGRKTDVNDATWLAQLAAYGLLRSSFVPPEPIRELRDLTRARAIVVRDRTRQIHRLEKFLESSGIKLSSVATDLVGVSGRAMLEALINGQDDPTVLADLAKARMRSKMADLIEALTGRFDEHHAFMARLFLDRIDAHSKDINRLDMRLHELMAPFEDTRVLLMSIPGISERVADVIIAETGADMSVFPTAAHLASWAGTAPGSNESAGRVKSTKTRPGNRYLKRALGTAALSITRSKTTYLGAKYRRIKSRRGPMKALVAVEHSILIASWHMLTNSELYTDPGPDYFVKRRPTQTQARAIHQLESLGYTVTLEPLKMAG